MRAIIISVQPQHCENILNLIKTLEIRKTKPSCELPIKVYIYCTNSKKDICWYSLNSNKYFTTNKKDYDIEFAYMLNGSVVAEFTLNKVTEHPKNFIDCEGELSYNFLTEDVKKCGFKIDIDGLCDFDSFVENYGKGKPLYAWHIDDLKIYDTPKDIREFKKPCISPECPYCPSCPVGTESISEAEQEAYRAFGECDTEWVCLNWLKKPPQSWCYVEKL